MPKNRIEKLIADIEALNARAKDESDKLSADMAEIFRKLDAPELIKMPEEELPAVRAAQPIMPEAGFPVRTVPLPGTLDLSLFAHVMNDPDLKGSPLQGHWPQNTTAHFLKFVSLLASDKIEILGISAREKQALYEQCQQMETLLTPLADFAKQIHSAKDKATLAEVAQNAVAELKTKGRILLPGGWKGTANSDGHATVYEFKLLDNGDILFLIWNTGAGIRHHFEKDSADKILHNTVKAYKIPALNTENAQEFNNYIIKILGPFINAQEKRYDADIIYKQIIPNIAFLQGEEIDPSPFVNELIYGQWSGTCAWQSLAALVRNYGFKDLDYEQVHYEIMRYTLEQFCDNLGEGWNNPDNINQIEFAVKNFALFLSDLAKKPTFSTERQLQGLALINKVKQQILEHAPLATTPEARRDLLAAMESPREFILATAEIVEPLGEAKPLETLQVAQPVIDMAQYNCNKLCELLEDTLAKAKDPAASFNRMKTFEEILLKLPLEQEYIQDASPEDLFKLSAALEAFTHYYCKLCKNNGGFMSAQRGLAVGCSLAMMHNIFEKIFENNPEISAMIERRDKYINNLWDSPFFTLTDSHLIDRKNKISEIIMNGINKTRTFGYEDFISRICHKEKKLTEIYALIRGAKPCTINKRAGYTYYIYSLNEEGRAYLKAAYPNIYKEVRLGCAYKNMYDMLVLLHDNKLDTLKDELEADSVLGNFDDFSPNAEEFAGVKYISLSYVSNPEAPHHNHKQYFLNSDNFDNTGYGGRGSNPLTISSLEIPDLHKRLKHVRIYSKSQCVEIIEFLRSELTNLRDPDILKTIFIDLFQNGLLHEEINKNPEAISVLVGCLEKGFAFYASKKNQSAHMYLYQISVYLNECLSTSPKSKDPEIKSFNDRISQVVNQFDALTNGTHDLTIRNHSRYLKIINLKNVYRQNGELTPEQWVDFFKAHLLIRQFDNSQVDPFLVNEAESAIDYLNVAFRYKAELPRHSLIKKALLQMGVSVTGECVGKFPNLSCGDYIIDLTQGRMYDKGIKMENLPENPLFSKIFGHAILAREISHATENKIFAFTYLDNNYIARVSADNKVVLQRTMQINDSVMNYQYCEDPQALFEQLPHTLGSDNKNIWKAANGNFIITDQKSHKKLYYYDNEAKAVFKLNEASHPEYQLMHLSKDEAYLKNFEDPRFIEMWQNVNTNELQIHFPRYGLHFHSIQERDRVILVCDEFPKYRLLPQAPSPIAHFKGSLTLAPIDNESPSQYLYLMPNQGFLPTKEQEGDFYHLQFDTANELKKAAFVKLHDLKKETLEDKIHFHHYANQEQYAIFKPGPHGTLKASNTKDALQLATIYMASRQPQKALTLLKAQLNHFSGTLEEIQLLQRLVMETPSTIPDKKLAEEAQVNGPEYVAVRLYAHLMLALFLNKGKGLVIPKEPSMLEGTINQDAAQYQKQNALGFVGSSSGLMQQALEQYLAMKAYVPASMRLTHSQVLTLINHIKANRSADAIPFYLQVQLRKRKFSRLIKEYYSLQALVSRSLQQEAQLKRIEELLAKNYTFVPKGSKLKPNVEETKLVRNGLVLEENQERSLAIDQLSMMTDEMEIARNLLYLFECALKNSDANQKLCNFLDKKIQSLLPHLSTLEEDNLGTYANIFLLRAMLKHPDVSKQVLDAKVKDDQQPYDYLRNNVSRVLNLKGERLGVSDLTQAFSTLFKDEILPYPVLAMVTVAQEPVTLTAPAIAARKGIERPAPKTILQTPRELLEEMGLSDLFAPISEIPSVEPAPVFVKTKENEEPYIQSLIDESNRDYQAGVRINQEALIRNELYLSILPEESTLENISKKLTQNLQASVEKFNTLEADIVNLMNKGPSELRDKILWELDLAGKTVEKLSLQEALAYFAKYHLDDIAKKRRLVDSDLQNFNALVHTYLIENSKRQQMTRANEIIQKIKQLRPEESFDKKTLIAKLGQTLTQNRAYDPYENPSILVFENLDDKLLYPNQVEILKKFFEKDKDGHYVSKVIQLIMGGGKSKLLLPLLAKMRPNGTNLCIIEVTPEMFETNFADLEKICLEVFGQTLHAFEFRRDIKCDADYFYKLREHFRSIIANKESLLTTRKSMDSLMLKYIELLSVDVDSLGEGQAEWEAEVKILDDIIHILKNQGDIVIDEMDSNLNPKDQLIYTAGLGQPLDKQILGAIVNLYDFFKTITFSQSGKTVSLHEVVTQKASRPSSEKMMGLIAELAERLIVSDNSAVQHIIKAHPEINKAELLTFLKNEHLVIPLWMTQLSATERDILAVTKEEISHLLGISLLKDENFHYGLSKDPEKSGLEKEIAIPYLGSNAPNEAAKFQNQFLTLNYTIQIQLAKPISNTVIEQVILAFKNRREVESALNAHCEETVNAVFDEFFMMTGLSIDNIDVENTQQMGAIYEMLKENMALKNYCLTELILPTILYNPKSLASNTQNHVDIFQSVAGFTGTDYNFNTFHPSIIRDNSLSFGTDGQTIDNLLKNDRQAAHMLQTDSTQALFDVIKMHLHKERIHALMDSGALFKGKPNLQVAKELLAILNVKYVLFFDEANKLSALSENGITTLASTEDVAKNLMCKPEDYFTYYDQRHTTGVDIEHAPNTIGLATVSEHNTLRDISQSAMRLRRLKEDENCEFVIMNSLLKTQEPTFNWTVQAVINTTMQTQANLLMQIHLSSSLQKIHNQFRSDALRRIREAPNPMEKARLAKAFNIFLFEEDTDSLFNKFASPEQLMPLDTMLTAYMSEQMYHWQECLNKAQLPEDELLQSAITSQCKQIITQAMTNCEQKVKSTVEKGIENQVVAQQQTQSQVQAQSEQEAEVEEPPWMFQFAFPFEWCNMDFRAKRWRYNKTGLENEAPISEGVTTHPLEDLFKDFSQSKHWHFDENIEICLVKKHGDPFTEKDIFKGYKLPTYFTLCIAEENQIKQILIPLDIAITLCDILPNMPKDPSQTIWIETPSGITFSGKKPEGIEHNLQYQRQREQIQFFNGDISALAGKKQDLLWLNEESKEKMDFLEKYIVPCSPSKASLMPILKGTLTAMPEHKAVQEPLPFANNFAEFQQSLWVAAQAGQEKIMRALMTLFDKCYGYPTDVASKSALMMACEAGDVDAIKLILRVGADVNYRDSEGKSALNYAMEHQQKEVIGILIDAKARQQLNEQDFWEAVKRNNTTVVQQLIHENPDSLNKQDAAGYTALMHAAMYGHLELIRWLLAAGADFNLKNEKQGNIKKISEEYIGNNESDDDVNESDDDVKVEAMGITALQYAKFRNQQAAVRLLQDASQSKPAAFVSTGLLEQHKVTEAATPALPQEPSVKPRKD